MKIAVTGLNNTDNPGPGVPVIRSLLESGDFSGEIIGLVYDSLDPGMYLPGLTKSNYLIPYPSGGLEILFERLSQINQKEGIDFLIPTLDSELFGFSKIAERLSDIGIRTYLPSKEQLMMRSKDKLYDFCEKNGILTPEILLVSSLNDMYKISSKFDYPVVVKGIFYDAYVVNNFDEAIKAFDKIRIKWGLPVIVQEFIQGDEFNIAGLGNGDGDTVGAVAMKKLYITDKGKGWAGITIYDELLLKNAYKIIENLGWRGGLELEFAKEKKSNRYYLLEINPRFPAWIYLTVGAGQNLPSAMLRLASGHDIEPLTYYKVGTIFIRYSWDNIIDIKRFEELSVNGEIHND
jgi:carbamoyl-phosphate synthase large subunit